MAEDIKKEIQEIASDYDNISVKKAEYDNGQMTMNISVAGNEEVGSLPDNVEILSEEKIETADLVGSVDPIYNRASASLRRIDLDPLTRDFMDLAKTSVLEDTPQNLFKRSIDYWRSKPIYGTVINILTNFAAKGFENDIDDETIKNFYDNWGVDVGFDDIVEKIFFDFFRTGMVRTYKVLGRYEPKINFLSSVPGQRARAARKETALRGNRFTKSMIPIAYTVLNPTMVEIKGSLMFGQTATFLKAKAGEDIKKIMELPSSEKSEFQKKIIKSLPADFKRAIKDGKDIPLDPELIGEVDYRRMPYERYPIPRGARAFESVEFKEELRKADYSTLDGITNYILKITVGNDNHPVTKQEVLERVGEMFDTVSKSFKVVWNHTLNVEKITSPEVGDILGPDKYEQVDRDLTAALGIPRALLDGEGDSNPAMVELAVKSLTEEINYARRQVRRWIYKEYRAVAQAMGFDRFPKVRFDDRALKDELQYMSVIQGMIDRRIISYRTGQEDLGYDHKTEVAQMEREKDLVQNGTLGILGSPFQRNRNDSNNVQREQRAPRGTPSEGRPKGRPAKRPEKDNESASFSAEEIVENALNELSLEDLERVYSKLIEEKSSDGKDKK